MGIVKIDFGFSAKNGDNSLSSRREKNDLTDEFFHIKYPMSCGGVYRPADPKLSAAISKESPPLARGFDSGPLGDHVLVHRLERRDEVRRNAASSG
jgi:hypothetical protein